MKLFQKQGLEFRLGSRVTSAKFDASQNKCIVQCADAEPIPCDRVLVAVGRTPATQDLGLETAGIALGEGAIFRRPRFQILTAGQPLAGHYAIGDCIPGPMLAHKARRRRRGFAWKALSRATRTLITTLSHRSFTRIRKSGPWGKTEDQLQADRHAVSQRHISFPR